MLVMLTLRSPLSEAPMDADDLMPFCEILGCRWHILPDVDGGYRCQEHGVSPVYAFRVDEWGGFEEYRALVDVTS